jgi:hypothetical protein
MTANAKAPKISVKPSSLRFEPLNAGGFLGSSSAKSVVIENTGLSDLIFGTVNTDNITDFSLSNNCPPILESGASCTMDFSFMPDDIGTKTGFVIVNSNDPKKPSALVKCTGKSE